MKRMLASRGIVLGFIVLCATALVGAAGLLVRPGKPTPVVAVKPAAAPVAVTAKQEPAQDPRCALQDKDDDEKEGKPGKETKVKTTKPDTDDDELECGDKDDDGGVLEDHDKHGEHAKKAAEKHDAPKAGKPPAGK